MKLIQHVEPKADWPEMGVGPHGHPIRLADVETILPAGEQRAQVHFVHPKGHKVWPWKEAGYYVDDEGKPMAPVFDVVPMSPEELAQTGLDDATLWSEYQAYFEAGKHSPFGGPDIAEVQVTRRRMYQAVTAAWYSQTERRKGV